VTTHTTARRRIPWPGRGYWPRSADASHDLSAAATVALVSIAEGMAYAIVAGVDPVYGLYAGSITMLVGSLFASTSLLVITATNALALVTADKIGALGTDTDHATAMFTLTVLVGAVMLGLGLARLGSVVRFISAEVQAGLVAAVALLIIVGQIDELTGYTSTRDVGKVAKAIDVVLHLPTWNGPTIAVGLGCIAALVVAKRTFLRPYADIVAMVGGTAVVWLLNLTSVETVGDIGHIPTGLAAVPTPHLPDVSLMPTLIPAAIAAAIVGLSEAATVGAAYPNPDGSRSDVSRDFVAQGAANLAGGLFRALPGGGSLSRTGVNTSAGARSRWAGVYAGALLVVFVAVAGGLAERIPTTTLVAILIVIGAETLAREVRHLVAARWVSKPHLVAAAVTIVVGLAAELTEAIFTGVALSLLLYVVSAGDRARLWQWVRDDKGRWIETEVPEDGIPSGKVTVLSVTGPAYFASAYRAEQTLPDLSTTHGAAVVLQLRDRSFYSLTGIDLLRQIADEVHAAHSILLLADVGTDQREALERTGLLADLGAEHVVWRSSTIGAAVEEAVRIGEQWVATHGITPSG
jgi:SulP family sulfate permease